MIHQHNKETSQFITIAEAVTDMEEVAIQNTTTEAKTTFFIQNEKYKDFNITGICRYYQQVILPCPRSTVEAATLVIFAAGLCEKIIKYTRVRVAITLQMERY